MIRRTRMVEGYDSLCAQHETVVSLAVGTTMKRITVATAPVILVNERERLTLIRNSPKPADPKGL